MDATALDGNPSNILGPAGLLSKHLVFLTVLHNPAPPDIAPDPAAVSGSIGFLRPPNRLNASAATPCRITA